MLSPSHVSRRFLVWLTRPLRICFAFSVLLATPAVADEPDDDEVVEEPQPPVLDGKFPVVVSNAYAWVFGRGYDADLARGQLETLLQQKIGTFDVICDLTDGQKRRLQLAGHGDVKRLIDRLEDIETRLPHVREERALLNPLLGELGAIKQTLKSDFSADGSLFNKVLRRTLTDTQNARIATLREIERIGGAVHSDSIGPVAALEISLSGIPIANEDLAGLAGLTSLRTLNLTSTPVTDDGLIHLRGLTKLQTLDLTGTKVTDSGLVSLSRLTALKRLELFATTVTSAGLAHLSALTSLNELNLSDTRVADAGLVQIQGLKKLHSFNLHKTLVTDAGLVSLREMASLEWLDVSGTQVSDAGLIHLRPLRNLQWVNLSGTQVTDAGLADLKLALPNANIWKRPVPAQN